MANGKLIVLEGACDGVGKSTQAEMLYNHFHDDRRRLIKHHFPSYGTIQGAPVERYLNGDYGDMKELSPYFINSLYACDRAITWKQELKHEYEKGSYILLDRYTTSSLIYQSALIDDIEEKKKFIDYVIDFEYNKLGIKEPDIVIFMYAPFDLIMKIRKLREDNEMRKPDIHEKNMRFMKKAYENAMFVADYLSWIKINCYDGHGMKSRDEIHREIYNKIMNKE